MPIPAGTQLGPYEIQTQIGAGGMGEVYQARDTRLGRDVALKVLPEQFARDPERLARFQREAKLLAALNHPNIAAIYGLEESAGVHYLIMELVPGQTLAERLRQDGPILLEEALKIARQIAEALEAAHGSDKGIIHRDLKPANIKVTPEGRVKVLDFGLAKAFTSESAPEDVANSPTLSMNPTMQGVIMGTAAYMSPEQAKGKTVNKATDIFAFGAVLYEMLTGKQAFQGDDVGDILATVVKTDPDWSKLPSDTPPSIKTLLRRCLRKDRSQRLQDAATLRIEIEDTISGPAPPEAIPTAANRQASNRRQAILVGVTAIVFLAIGAAAAWILKPAPVTLPPIEARFTITLPGGQRLAGFEQPTVALSPDGNRLAYVAVAGGVQQLYVRAMDGTDAKPLSGTERGFDPFFSPDGQWLGFFADGKVKKISVSGGPATILGDAGAPRGGGWGNLGTIAFSPTALSPLLQVSDTGGGAQQTTRLDKNENTNRWPDFLPGDKALLFTAGTAVPAALDSAQIAVQPLGAGERRNLIPDGVQPRYATSGHLVYVQSANLMVAPFDPRGLAVKGPAISMVEGVAQSPVTGAAQYSISKTGSLVYVSGGLQGTQRKLVWLSRDGKEEPVPAPARAYQNPRLSPDGRRIAVSVVDQGTQAWLYDLSSDTLRRLTFEGKVNNFPSWTPDGKHLAFASDKAGFSDIFWQLADGAGGFEQLTNLEYAHPNSWSPDGQLLAFVQGTATKGYGIWVLRMADRKAQPLLQTAIDETAPRFSPDGHWLAYASDESGRSEVFIQPYPGPGGKWQISTEGGTEPMWNPNGRELFYRSGDKMMAVDITTQPPFSAGKPRMLFSGPYLPDWTALGTNYDISPDGRRFLMVKPVDSPDAGPAQINVVLNWFEELKHRVPPRTK